MRMVCTLKVEGIFGCCGRPAIIRVMPPMSTVAAASARVALMSTMLELPFAPLLI